MIVLATANNYVYGIISKLTVNLPVSSIAMDGLV